MKEEALKDKYPNASLHNIDKNRVCLTIKQLKLILNQKDDDFNNIFIDLCQKELKKKNNKSLDFYDTSTLIDKALKERKKDSNKSRSNKLKKATFKEEEEVYEEKESGDQYEEEKYEKEEFRGQIRMAFLEQRLKKLEERVDNIEEVIKEGY